MIQTVSEWKISLKGKTRLVCGCEKQKPPSGAALETSSMDNYCKV